MLFFVSTELLDQAQLTRESAAMSPSFASDFRRSLETTLRLLEGLMKVTAGYLFLLFDRLDLMFMLSLSCCLYALYLANC